MYSSVVEKVKAKDPEPAIDPFAGMAGGQAVSAKAARAGGRGTYSRLQNDMLFNTTPFWNSCMHMHMHWLSQHINSTINSAQLTFNFFFLLFADRKSCAASATHDDLSWSLSSFFTESIIPFHRAHGKQQLDRMDLAYYFRNRILNNSFLFRNKIKFI
jgi:hypothetical protein